ncbi:methylated-DNA--[protein]-cysteine S-methyltransferase [Sulfurimonas aquatica]|uniref:Methylated-DNA--protein-cysteine methyltransferase n=1 Tax=Sulfurimonas aquatica TaxID=2672570 RepID=A0A975GCZ7_9BACT|nr:methylated-DNA--[protein]-cysteine S-methyltransferase [Sulfurimonas aquatica]QSZ41828.1 methylated-DNA--[protein]-cysteine S-methyltransferase [Sulfurimonas aquatica]
MKNINISYYNKCGVNYRLGSYDEKLCLLESIHSKNRVKTKNRLQKGLDADYVESEDAVLKQTAKELNEYFEGKRKNFDVPLVMVGSEFQKSVWEALLKIPYSETSTYKDQAKSIGNEKAVRAVANANGANAISIIIPCHRIIGSDGSLTGYAGGLELKQRLLEIEKN